MSNPNDYTVGWICAITTEYVAAQEFLDEEHEGPEFVSPHDDNHYSLGKVGKHNVVIAVLPDNEYGKASAASVARNMMHSFPNVRFGLMVGIAGGAPGKHDIRLGDIVVGCAGNGHGGVLGYDFGKAIQGQGFQETGFLNQPPTLLRTTVNGLKARYERKGHQLSEAVGKILENNTRLRRKYSQPESGTDSLFQPEVTHDLACTATCSDDVSNLILRSERPEDEDNPVVHYGLIASADRLMKDALERDRLSNETEVLCFEMEAAGLVNHFPCLVIRGIYHYSDSHKNKQWQGYAAMVAAAYARDFLYEIAPSRVEAERKISDIVSGIQEIAQEQLQAQKDVAKEKLLKEQRKCHQLFRLTTNNIDATYEWYKDRVEERVDGTCMWFLEHDHFQTWLNQKSGPLLVSADPGCGKSVLAKYLIDYQLPRSTTTICYFFFKDQDQNTVRQAICALLHQLFSLKPPLIEHAMPQFSRDGVGLVNSTASLWEILRNVVKDPQTGPAIIVLDALDECAELEFKDLVRNIKSQFCNGQVGYGNLKYLLTCRPYDHIVERFNFLLNSFPNIRIPGEEKSEVISREVNHVIKRRIHELAKEKGFTVDIRNHLENRLQEATHRTYLWVHLVFDYLQKHTLKRTPKGIESAVATLPTSVNEAYEQILNKANEGPILRRVLSIILAASRPLNLSEMNVALNVNEECKSIYDLDLEDDKDFKTRLRSLCGLFVSIYQDNIYLLHQTAREFLTSNFTSSETVSSKWHHSITTRQAHTTLAEICVVFLNLYNSNAPSPRTMYEEFINFSNRPCLLHYSVENWGAHVREADFMETALIIPTILKICDTRSRSYAIWSKYSSLPIPTNCLSSLMVASCYGQRAIVNLLLTNGAEIEAQNPHGQTPLMLAATYGHEATVKLLLDRGANIEAKDNTDSRTPLILAATHGHQAIFKLLLQRGVNIERRNSEDSYTPLLRAAVNGDDDTVKLLLEGGADIEAKDTNSRTPLLNAVMKRHTTTVKLLLRRGADIEAKDRYRRTPLLLATSGRDYATIKLLLEEGADTSCVDTVIGTPLVFAIEKGDIALIKLLLDKGASVDCENGNSETPLSVAVQTGREGIVQLLLEKGATIECQNRSRETPLLVAAQRGHHDIVELLLKKGSAIECKNRYGQTPLLAAADRGYDWIVELLLQNGAAVECRNAYRKTPLLVAAQRGHDGIVRQLLEKGASVQSQDIFGQTALSCAEENGYQDIVNLLSTDAT
ncbi:hypothetical protein FSST1_006975 [Fusarium sambucinum]